MSGPEDSDRSAALVSKRTMDIVVALVLLAGSCLVIFDSVRVGHGWLEGQGPGPGFFPFYVALLLAIASIVNLVRALLRQEAGGGDSFVSRTAIWRVLAVLVPTLVYVGLIPVLGIYLASALLIAGFMLAIGGGDAGGAAARSTPGRMILALVKALTVGILVPVVLFLMFEVWFKVPLTKGPLEAMLGY